jgi:DHA3 family macrolide efflux protein-like MFS transporter
MSQFQSRWALPFFTIWTGQAISQLGSRMAGFALIWWMTKTTGSATVLATGSFLAYLPDVLLGPFVGVLVDRWNRKIVMIISDTAVALASAWLAYLFWTNNIQVWHVYVINLIRSLGSTFQSYAMMASTSLMVPEGHLSRVQGANQTLHGALNIGAPPLGALLLAVLPMHTIMGLDVITFAFAVIPLFFIFVPQPPRTEQTKPATRPSLLADIQAGLRYIWNWPGLMGILIIGASMNFFLNSSPVLVPLLVTNHFGGGALQLGWLESAFGVGIIAGGMTLSFWGGFRRRILNTLMGLAITGLGTLLVGLAPEKALWLALAGMFIGGVMSAFINGPMMAVLQAAVAPDMQGRVFSVIGSSVQITTMLGLMVVGPLADLVGVRFWFIVGGVLVLLMGPVGFFIPAIVNIESQKPGRGNTSF